MAEKTVAEIITNAENKTDSYLSTMKSYLAKMAKAEKYADICEPMTVVLENVYSATILVDNFKRLIEAMWGAEIDWGDE